MAGRSNDDADRTRSTSRGDGSVLWRYHSFVLFGIVAGLFVWTQVRATVQEPRPTLQAGKSAEPAAKTSTGDDDSALKLALKTRDEGEQRLLEAQKEFGRVREQIRKLTPLSASHLRDRISINEIAQTKLRTEKIKLDNADQSIKSALAAGMDKNVLLTAVLKVSNDPPRERDATAPRDLEESLSLLELQEKDLLQVLGPDHPEVVDLRKRMDWTRLRLRVEGKPKAQGVPVKKVHPLDLHVQMLEQEIEANSLQTRYVTNVIEEDRTMLNALNELTDKEKALGDQCDRLAKALAGYEDRVFQLQIERAQRH